jgi:NTP pyrophosphatase (non-canonical NTP hydrolase)
MEFKELEAQINRKMEHYATKYNITVDENWAVFKLLEELGEFSQSIIIHRKQSRPEKHLPSDESKQEMASELADVIGTAIACAKIFDIDLEDALSKKWTKKENV